MYKYEIYRENEIFYTLCFKRSVKVSGPEGCYIKTYYSYYRITESQLTKTLRFTLRPFVEIESMSTLKVTQNVRLFCKI